MYVLYMKGNYAVISHLVTRLELRTLGCRCNSAASAQGPTRLTSSGAWRTDESKHFHFYVGRNRFGSCI